MEITCYRRFLHISYKNHITNAIVRNKESGHGNYVRDMLTEQLRVYYTPLLEIYIMGHSQITGLFRDFCVLAIEFKF